jgi:cytochrome c oxidase subunit 3
VSAATRARGGYGDGDGDGDGEAARDVDSMLGMTILLGAWVMLFAALFLAYGVVRVQAPEWPPYGAPRLPRVAPGINTLLLLASSLVLRRGLAAARGGRRRAFLTSLGTTMVLGVAFLAAQLATWTAMRARGLFPSSGVYGSVFFAFTGFHALHVLGGLLVLAVVTVGAVRRQAQAAPALRPARLTALYWDFLAAIWLLMYLSIYLL